MRGEGGLARIGLWPVRSRLLRRLFGLERADRLPLELTARRVYILPTRAGLVFLALVAAMLLGSVNYALSMGYLFSFLLLGLYCAGLFATWRNLMGLRLEAIEAPPVFAGEPLTVALHLSEPLGRSRPALAAEAIGARGMLARLPARAGAVLTLQATAARRGRLPLAVVRLYSEYPLGLFQAWALVHTDATVLVWPRPAGVHRLPEPGAAGDEASTGRRRGAEDFDGLRPPERGEPPARIAWKSLARHEEALAKSFVGPAARQLWLDWCSLPTLAPEARLSQLARWVLEAERAGRPYGLRLPGATLAPGLGLAHRNRCLTALALAPRSDSVGAHRQP
ncbi:MAG: DUF58 domain-containing protein [Burkholderiales bacterium]|nr:DUF58 domain-containing protein [Burkholderiales bacterium]